MKEPDSKGPKWICKASCCFWFLPKPVKHKCRNSEASKDMEHESWNCLGMVVGDCQPQPCWIHHESGSLKQSSRAEVFSFVTFHSATRPVLAEVRAFKAHSQTLFSSLEEECLRDKHRQATVRKTQLYHLYFHIHTKPSVGTCSFGWLGFPFLGGTKRSYWNLTFCDVSAHS